MSNSCDPMDCSPPGSSAHGILQARILEWVAISSSRGSSWPRDWNCISCTGWHILYYWATWPDTAASSLWMPISFQMLTSIFSGDAPTSLCKMGTNKMGGRQLVNAAWLILPFFPIRYFLPTRKLICHFSAHLWASGELPAVYPWQRGISLLVSSEQPSVNCKLSFSSFLNFLTESNTSLKY